MLLILLSVDFFPNLPDASLDSSWMNGLTTALAQGAVPGRDLLFTYGPLAGMLTAYAGPGFGLGLALALAIAFNFAVLLRSAAGRRFLPAAVLVCLLSPSNESLFYLFLGVIPLAAARSGTDGEGRGALLTAAVLAPALTLAKLSFLPLSAVLLLLTCAFEAMRGRWRVAVAGAALFCASLAVLWLLGGRALGDLPGYLLDGEIIKGYTSAMEWDLGVAFAGVNLQMLETVLLYLTSAALLVAIIRSARGVSARTYLLLAMAAVLTVVIKAAVVRHGGVHSVFPWILLCVLALAAVPGPARLPRLARLICGCALALTVVSAPIYNGDGTSISRIVFAARDHAVAQGLDWQSLKRSPGYWRSYVFSAPGTFLASLPSPLAGLAERSDNAVRLARAVASGGDSFRDAAARSRQAILAACPIARVDGSVDIYPTDINCLLVHDMAWKPRPVFQSYSAYTPRLLTLNRAHVAGSGAPDHLFVDVRPIDERLPVLEEGHGWTCLAQRYRPAGPLQGTFLPLVRAGGDCSVPGVAETRPARLGEAVVLSCDRPQVTASFDFQPTVTGRLASMFYKTRRLVIDVRTCDGESRSFRFVPGMAALPLPLSPLVENADELRHALFDGDSPRGRRIESFVIRDGVSESPIPGWSAAYTVHLHDAGTAAVPRALQPAAAPISAP
ncbi:hypothetical protein [Roseateles noduli]|uniref:hypothetical protein n=1 Tax=Roseateles noduli TaxID=2052484 RepID=UPI003D64E056